MSPLSPASNAQAGLGARGQQLLGKVSQLLLSPPGSPCSLPEGRGLALSLRAAAQGRCAVDIKGSALLPASVLAYRGLNEPHGMPGKSAKGLPALPGGSERFTLQAEGLQPELCAVEDNEAVGLVWSETRILLVPVKIARILSRPNLFDFTNVHYETKGESSVKS